MSSLIEPQLQHWRAGANIGTLFTFLAALVVVMALYSLVAQNVAERTSEIGVRLAIGAQQLDIAWLTLRSAVSLTGAGLVLGVVLALAPSRMMRPILFGDGQSLLPAIGVIATAVMLLTILAVALPIRRAVKVDPAIAMKA